MDSNAGNAWVGLRVQLGHAPGPLHQQLHPTYKKSDCPSRQRRRARRAAARAEFVNAEEATNPTTTAQTIIGETEKASTEEVEVAEEAATDQNDIVVTDAPAEEAIANGLKCLQCERNFRNERGLNSHIRQAHKDIPQVDGAIEELERLYKFESEFAIEDVMYTLEEVCTEEVEIDLISRVKAKVGDITSGEHVFTIRVSHPTDDWKWPEMNTMQREILMNLRKESSFYC